MYRFFNEVFKKKKFSGWRHFLYYIGKILRFSILKVVFGRKFQDIDGISGIDRKKIVRLLRNDNIYPQNHFMTKLILLLIKNKNRRFFFQILAFYTSGIIFKIVFLIYRHYNFWLFFYKLGIKTVLRLVKSLKM